MLTRDVSLIRGTRVGESFRGSDGSDKRLSARKTEPDTDDR